MRELYALLQTDIVDSTQLNEQLGDAAMSAVWESHDRLSRNLLREWHGRELDRTDGFLLLFPVASDAVAYALAYHKALLSLSVPVRSRAGLHVGALSTRTNPSADVELGARQVEFEGLAVATTNRVMSLAKSGQTLLTVEAKHALGDSRFRIERHGHWRMKGLEEPIEIFEIGGGDAPFAPPSDVNKAYRVVRASVGWIPVRELPNNLPAERDLFVGRRDVILDLSKRFDSGARVVSLLGIGGIGKTRVALHYAHGWMGDYSGGAWFCDLSAARGADGIVRAVAQALNVPLGSSDPVKQLGTAIAGRGRCILILDNFEQVARYAEETLGAWIERASDARFVITSREMLGIAGEQALVLPPLSGNEATSLFRQRVQAGALFKASWGDDVATIGALVELLDRLPLAIELAAARARVMPPHIQLQRMGERFRLLATTSGRRDRQATLRATLDWSWDLLSPAEKSTLAQLSVFERGFSLEMAQRVVNLAAFSDSWFVDVLQSLVQKSLVRQIHDTRFDLLLSVQDYAAERLRAVDEKEAAPVGQLATTRRHWTVFATLEGAAVGECVADLDNLMLACRRASNGRDKSASASCLVAAWQALKMAGPFRAALALVEDVDKVPIDDATIRAKVYWVAGKVRHLLGEQDLARRSLEQGLASALETGDLGWQARLLCAAGEQLTTTGQIDAANAQLLRALDLARRANTELVTREVLNSLGALATAHGNLKQARQYYEEALGLCAHPKDADFRGGLLGNLGEVCMSLGSAGEAREYFELALTLVSRAGHRRWEGNTRCNLGLLHHEQGNSADAKQHFQAALQIAREIGYTRLEATVLCNLGIQHYACGSLADALDCQQQAVSIANAHGDVRAEGQFQTYLAQVLIRLNRLEQASQCLARGEKLLREMDDLISLSLLLCERSHLFAAYGQMDRALESYNEAERLGERSGAQVDSELGNALRRTASIFRRSTDKPSD